MDTREIINQLDESQYDEEFKGFTLGKGFAPNRYIPEHEGHALTFQPKDINGPEVLGFEVDRRPGHRTLSCANEAEIIKAHMPSKRKKIGHEPSRLESFMTNREKNLVSIEFGEVSEKKPSKFEVTFYFSDGSKECKTFDEDEVKVIKDKYSTYIKQKEEMQPESNLESTTTKNAELDLDEKFMVLSSKWKPLR